MGGNLLREYISLIVEGIHSKRGVDSKMGSKFDLKKFKSLDILSTVQQYAKTYLEPLGTGSSRIVYLLSSRYALKIALNNKGLAQNEAEVDVATNPQTKAVVAKVYASDEGFKWVISDLVKPVQSEQEFEDLAGVSWQDFRTGVSAGFKGQTDNGSPFVKSVVATAKSNELMKGDIIGTQTDKGADKLGHWGKTPDGRVVLLDYGYTRSVKDAHYAEPVMPRGKTSASGDKTAIGGQTKPISKGVDTDKNAKTAPARRKMAVGAEDDVDSEKTRR